MLSGKVIIINHGLEEKQGLIKIKKAIKTDLLKRLVEKRRGRGSGKPKLTRMIYSSHWKPKLELKEKNLTIVMMIL